MSRKQRLEPIVTASVPDLLEKGQWQALVHFLTLSSREAEVLRCMFSDERTSAICARLGVSEGTVHTYRERIFRKVRVHSSTQLLAKVFAAYLCSNHRTYEANESATASITTSP